MNANMDKLNKLTHEIIGAAIEVHRALGPGRLNRLIMHVCVESWWFGKYLLRRSIHCHFTTKACIWSVATAST